MTKITLRDYQQQCVTTVLKKINEGVRLQVLVLATGLGKTTIFCSLPQYALRYNKKTLVLAHRDELVQQAKERMELMNPGVKIGIEKAEQTADEDSQIIIASVQTLGREGSERIKKFKPEEFGFIITDEVHHSTSTTYQNIYEHFGANKQRGLKNKHPVMVGVTATPNRRDNAGLNLLFDEMVFKMDIKDGIEQNYLTNIRAYTIFTGEDLSVGVRAGDFAIDELDKVVNQERRNNLIISSYKKICPGDRAVCFCTSVAHSVELARMFTEAGYKAASVCGETPKAERKQILDDFQDGKLDIICNMGILTEGRDCPGVRAVLFARPTTSAGLYIQMAGRGLRIDEGKTDCKFLDFVDNMTKHSIISASSIIGLDKPIKADGHNLMDLKDKFDQLLQNDPGANISEINLEELDAKITEVDIFKLAQLPEVVKNFSNYARTPTVDGFKLSLGKGEKDGAMVVEIKEDVLGQYIATFYKTEEQKPTFANGYSKLHKEQVATVHGKDKIDALEKADTHIFNNYKDRVGLIRQDAGWRTDKPSEKQIALLRKAGYPNADKLSKGEACNLLSKYFAEKEANKGATKGYKRYGKKS